MSPALCIVCEDCINLALVFPTLGDIPNRIGVMLPIEAGLVDEFEERSPILVFLTVAGSKPPWCNCEDPQV